jgi:hypothetical protein
MKAPAPTASGQESVNHDAHMDASRRRMPVNPPPDHTLSAPRASIRMDARLDSATRTKVDDLAARFHRPRAAVLRHIMHWGLRREPTGPLDEVVSHGPGAPSL